MGRPRCHRDGLWEAVDVVRREVEAALAAHGRVEAWSATDDVTGQRVATWAGMRREGVMRGVGGDRIVYARLESDAPASEPEGFRALLNSFLPRKRAISQMLVRDTDDRVLLCQLTYKQDWDLPGGVVEVGESPQLAVAREVTEELGLDIKAGNLVLTDWLPAVGRLGRRDLPGLRRRRRTRPRSSRTSSARSARSAPPSSAPSTQVRERAADFTARRVESALANLGPGAPAYTESGR